MTTYIEAVSLGLRRTVGEGRQRFYCTRPHEDCTGWVFLGAVYLNGLSDRWEIDGESGSYQMNSAAALVLWDRHWDAVHPPAEAVDDAYVKAASRGLTAVERDGCVSYYCMDPYHEEGEKATLGDGRTGLFLGAVFPVRLGAVHYEIESDPEGRVFATAVEAALALWAEHEAHASAAPEEPVEPEPPLEQPGVSRNPVQARWAADYPRDVDVIGLWAHPAVGYHVLLTADTGSMWTADLNSVDDLSRMEPRDLVILRALVDEVAVRLTAAAARQVGRR